MTEVKGGALKIYCNRAAKLAPKVVTIDGGVKAQPPRWWKGKG